MLTMKNTKDNAAQLRSFESLFYNKGYSGQFELLAKGDKHFHHLGSLKECLQSFLSFVCRNDLSRQEFSLKTEAEYRNADDYKECQFIGVFDMVKGFAVNRIFIESRCPNETLQLKLRNNQEIPGKNGVIGRFRRPEPWVREMRGDFKFRRRR